MRLPAGLRPGAVVAIALAIAVGVWLIVRDGDEDRACAGAAPRAATAQDLRAFAGTAPVPVYWAGPRGGHTYELTETAQCNLFVRYLPDGVSAGDKRPNFTTVGTYPYDDAYETLQALGSRSGSTARRAADGGILVFSDRNPRSVYMAFPRQDYQVEVYDRSPRRALRLALRRVRPVL
jgi:hypothetical protein